MTNGTAAYPRRSANNLTLTRCHLAAIVGRRGKITVGNVMFVPANLTHGFSAVDA
jgi:hypothetical protein